MTPRWTATGLSQDLPKGVVMAGHWQGHDLAVWRSATGRLQAWNDRCPHRGMRPRTPTLSKPLDDRRVGTG